MEKEVKEIHFPNTTRDINQNIYKIGSNCDEIKRILKAGEMCNISWFEIIKDKKTIAEIKESVCDVFFATKVEL